MSELTWNRRCPGAVTTDNTASSSRGGAFLRKGQGGVREGVRFPETGGGGESWEETKQRHDRQWT